MNRQDVLVESPACSKSFVNCLKDTAAMFTRLPDAGLLKIMFVRGAMTAAVLCSAPAFAQGPESLPQDWSHRHLIFSGLGVNANAATPGGTYKRSPASVTRDPRWELQVRKRARDATLAASTATKRLGVDGTLEGASGDLERETDSTGTVRPSASEGSLLKAKKPKPNSESGIKRDWSNVMGGATGVGSVSAFPAKFSFDILSKDCATDFVVFTTAAAGAQSTGTLAIRAATFPATLTPAGTVIVTNTSYNPDQILTLTAHASLNTGLNFKVVSNASGGNVTNATNLANAINRNGGTVGVTATNSGTATVTVRPITALGTGTNIVMSGTLTNIGAWSPTAGVAGAGQPTIFALNQLYKDLTANGGCQTSTQAVPATYWSYNTGTGSIAELSPVLSLDGSQVAFVQRTSGNVAQLVIMKWASGGAGTIGAPTDLTTSQGSAALYRACTAPCQYTISFNGSPNNTTSSPFVDYANDILYVGDAAGKLHKFTGVFNGNPAEVVSAGTNVWPAVVSTTALTPPVYDGATSKVFVGSARPASTAGTGALHAVDATIGSGTGGITSSSQLLANTFTARFDGPIVDSSTGKVYVFVGHDANAAAKGAIYQYSTGTSLATQGTGTKAAITTGKASTTLWSGAFDETYFSGPGNTGYMYVCGGTKANANPDAFRISMNGIFGSNVISTGSDLGPRDVQCSPVTSISDGSSDYIYMGVSEGNDGTCTDTVIGCIYMYKLKPGFDTTSTSSTMSSGNRFMSVSTPTGLNATEATVATTLVAAQAGSYRGMTITQGAVSPTGTTFTYTLRKGGISQTITCAIGPAQSTCSDLTNAVAFVAGNTIDVLVVRSGTANDLTTTFRVQLDPPSWVAATATAGLNAPGGTGGIIIDNTLTGGGSQVYYSTRTSPGIAVQASQAGLQ